ncbi:MAG: unsaturated chondroitin disaccharide hydrolase [Actinomycetota bacterium]|jgi:unsaturated chondroitin disaccharide hydrolase|nr:unsaturated chondroitin disaccharide hydrolase [Actinomycetota bacterium]
MRSLRAGAGALGLSLALACLATVPADAAPAPTGMVRLLPTPTSIFADKLRRAGATTPAGQFPIEARPGVTSWTTAGAWHWAAGFVPGQLWEMYRATGSPEWRRLAEAMDTTLPREARDTKTHDLGFMLASPYIPAYLSTHDEKYADLLRTAAKTLDTHWRPGPGVLWSWASAPPGQVEVIVDSLMNMELLFWASEHGGSAVLAAHAHSHVLRLARDAMRPDGSTVHVLDYDAASGQLVGTHTAQGYSDESAWARGQAWFFTGLIQAYAHTHDVVLLDAARKAARYYVDHLPADSVPYWDLSMPAGTETPRDTAAGAVGAYGLRLLALADPSPELAAGWRAAAGRTLLGLLQPPYLAAPSHPAVLTLAAHGQKDVAMQEETSFPYADYYLLKAMLAAPLLTPTWRWGRSTGTVDVVRR